jgi:hypothetical protein
MMNHAHNFVFGRSICGVYLHMDMDMDMNMNMKVEYHVDCPT